MHAHQIRKRSRLHFFHHPCAMNLHSALTDTELIRDHFVRLPGYHKIEDFVLALCQSIDTGLNFGMFLSLATALPIHLQRLADTIEQVLVPEWFLNEIDGTLLHCLDGHWHVAMTGDEYDG